MNRALLTPPGIAQAVPRLPRSGVDAAPRSYRARRRQRRFRQRTRFQRPPLPRPDWAETLPAASQRRRQSKHIAWYLVAAAALHVGTSALLAGTKAAEPKPTREDVRITMHTPPVIPPPPAAPVEPQIETEAPKMRPKVKAAPKPAPKAKLNPSTQAPKKVAPAPVPQEPTPARKPRRIVGLTLGSTTTGGSGPSFAIGNSTMGSTSSIAEDPNAVADTPTPTAAPQAPLKVATRVPGGGYTPPARLTHPQPEYPQQLRAQGVEANVVVRIHIDATGGVSRVTIVGASEHSAFDAAATASAMRGRYSPATRRGIPVATTITFTVKFRIVSS